MGQDSDEALDVDHGIVQSADGTELRHAKAHVYRKGRLGKGKLEDSILVVTKAMLVLAEIVDAVMLRNFYLFPER